MTSEYLHNPTFEGIITSFQFFKREKARYEMILSDLRETNERRISKYGDDLRTSAVTVAEGALADAGTQFKKHQADLAEAFYLLSENIFKCAKFRGIDQDDAVQEGVLTGFDKIDRFDPRKGKAFNYMTTCIWNQFRQMYRGAKHYHEFKKKYGNFLQTQMDGFFVRNGKDRPCGAAGLDRDSIFG